MESIIRLLKDPSWWFTAVFIGLFISVIAAYLKPLADRSFSHISESYRINRENKQKERQKEIEFLARYPDALIHYWMSTFLKILLSLAELSVSFFLWIHTALFPNSEYVIVKTFIGIFFAGDAMRTIFRDVDEANKYISAYFHYHNNRLMREIKELEKKLEGPEKKE